MACDRSLGFRYYFRLCHDTIIVLLIIRFWTLRMEVFAKMAFFTAAGLVLLACNIWLATTILQAFRGGDLVIAPVKVIGGTGNASAEGETLARLIIARLHTREWELQQSQSSLKDEKQQVRLEKEEAAAVAAAAAVPHGVTAGILGTPKTAVLNAQLFEPTSIDVKVGGVDVGGLLPSIQRWFAQDRTLSFAVSWEGKSAIVAGNIDALGLGKTKPLWMTIDDATEKSVADAIALALIHRRWAKDSPEFGELQDDEFSNLVNSIGEIARINRRVITYKVAAKSDFERIFVSVGPLTDRIAGWNELTYFAASIAEGAEEYDRALALYRRVQASKESKFDTKSLATKIAGLEALIAKATPDRDSLAVQRMRKHLADATHILNGLFGSNLAEPEINLLANDYLNAYWDGEKINAPPRVQNIPDIIYHEAAFPFILARWHYEYSGQEGALVQSYTDVLTSLIKQKVLNQTAQTADWVIAPGAISWITGKNDPADTRPLRSMKSPGTAYDDAIVGKDAQPDHFSKLVTQSSSLADDNGGVHINSGIPNRAFYEAAMQIGSESAGKIWIASLEQFKPHLDLRTAAKVIYGTAVKLHGSDSSEAKAVKAGFNTVGLL
ncbi:M4 family metallopeptidase [Bradyrhizobium guangdongense]|uniref:M4 family metallopeptidase n=1 Tax=Bradyrhizobium guangdongense TaxID=1325090 RepID=UPI001643351C|nr:M4 family metallopeptidase [Bradyrhizobium guangdongense]